MQVAGLLQLVTVQPLAGQVTRQPPGGHATAQLADVSHETLQVTELLQSTSQLGAPLHATAHAWPAWQVRSQSSSAVHTHVLGSLQVSSEPHPAAMKEKVARVMRVMKEKTREVSDERKNGGFTLGSCGLSLDGDA